MDLQERKLEFIEEYIRLSDEKIIDKLEKVLRSEKKRSVKSEIKSLTQAEMDNMIEESEEDIRLGNIISHDAVKLEVLSWPNHRKK
jgi:hypothetical protein